MSILYHEGAKTFHLTNGEISYLMKILPTGALGSCTSARRSATGKALTTCWR